MLLVIFSHIYIMLLVIFDHIEFTLRSNLTTNRISHLQIFIRPITVDNINCSMKKLSCRNLYRNIFIIFGQLLEGCRNQMCKSHFIPESFFMKVFGKFRVNIMISINLTQSRYLKFNMVRCSKIDWMKKSDFLLFKIFYRCMSLVSSLAVISTAISGPICIS